MSLSTLAPMLQFVLAERSWPMTPRLERLAACLPPIPCAGMEFSLLDEGAVDLQQRIRSPREIDQLARFLEPATGLSEHSWSCVRQFCATMHVGGDIEELWLELDDVAVNSAPPVSAFVRLAAGLPATAYPSVVGDVLDAFGCRSPAAQSATLARCLDACANVARISHVGLMLSRPGAPLCIIVDDLPADMMSSFLEHTGWPGSAAALERHFDTLFTHVDRVRLAMSFGDVVRPSLGVECFVGTPGAAERRWGNLLDALVDQGVCAAPLRDRVMSWPAVLTPASVQRAWPSPLVVNALARSVTEVGSIECRISHVKLTYEDGRVPRAKAYLGFVEVWQNLARDACAPTLRARTVHPPRTLGEAIDAAVQCLLAARVQTGWWLDYDGFLEGVSDEWVTAYVAHAVHEVGGVGATRAAERAWRLLAGRSREGWGWNYGQPADADSTTWALHLAARLGLAESPRAREALAFLQRHVRSDGVATYVRDHYAAWSRGTSATVSPGWFDAHDCVTAASAACKGIGDAPLQSLRDTQCANGSWASYWWPQHSYATAHAVDAFERRGAPGDHGRIDLACDWAALSLDAALALPADALTSSFDVSLALRTLTVRPEGNGPRIAATVGRLLECQKDDGSWPGSAVLTVRTAAGHDVSAQDTRRTFTTATVLRALHRVDLLERDARNGMLEISSE
ncbi:MAG: prenyltransferase/squalene oxidase repeat-containing protein [bacterium]